MIFQFCGHPCSGVRLIQENRSTAQAILYPKNAQKNFVRKKIFWWRLLSLQTQYWILILTLSILIPVGK